MPMGPFVIYGANKDDLRLQDLPGASVKAALVVSAYAPDAGTHGFDFYGQPRPWGRSAEIDYYLTAHGHRA